MRHVISVLVENKFGVLARIAGLFSGRGFNIDTLNVGPTHEDGRSRITVTSMAMKKHWINASSNWISSLM